MIRVSIALLFGLWIGGAWPGPRQHQADTPGPQVSHPAAATIRPDTAILDYPHGYYFPAETVTVSGYTLVDFALPLGRISFTRIDTDERSESPLQGPHPCRHRRH